LAGDLVALVHAFPAGQTRLVGVGMRSTAMETCASMAEGRDAGGTLVRDVDAGAGVVLSSCVWGEDFDGVIDA